MKRKYAKLDYIFMVHVANEFNFPQSPFSINNVVKCVTNLLDGNFLVCMGINSGTEKN